MSDGLLPSTPATRSVPAKGVLPPAARKWGRMLDLEDLEPGDLILFRPVNPNLDKISQLIIAAQMQAGFSEEDARWTHAAVYLGDGELICEANIWLAGF